MSIATEITRLQGAKADLKTAIEAKGVTVSSSALLDAYPALVDSIQTGDPNPTVGGRIFYIDSNSDETVEFYDAQGNVLSNIAVGDTPVSYKVTDEGTKGIKKYYVYSSTLSPAPTSAATFGTLYWGYYNITTNATGTYIGAGSPNKPLVYAITDTSGRTPSIWEWLAQQNTLKDNGCGDWYIPSKEELGQLQSYLAANADGSIIIDFLTGKWFWSSSENNSGAAWMWYNASLQSVNKAGGVYRTCMIRSF